MKANFQKYILESHFTTQHRVGQYGVVQSYYVRKAGCYMITALGAGGSTEGNLSPCKGAKVVTHVSDVKNKPVQV